MLDETFSPAVAMDASWTFSPFSDPQRGPASLAAYREHP
jgi:hypothetical protein